MKRSIQALFLIIILLLGMFLAQGEELQPDEEVVVVVASEGRALKLGDKGEDVRHLQTRLKDLRYYNGPVTGNYLDQTKRAVQAVQEAYGLDKNGNADLALLEIIYGDAHRPLARGERGKEVSRLQTRLSEVGYYFGQISGNYLDGTVSAVSAFQAANGLDSTGAADVQTLIRLYSDDIVLPSPDPNRTPAPVPSPPPDATYKGVVSYGNKTKQVTQVQERLAALGFFSRKVSGGFYQHTLEAVKAFQQYNGLVPDGAVGEQTWNVLFSDDVVVSGGIPKPTPAPTPIPYEILVDVTNQLVKVYTPDQQGAYTQLYKTFYCSTGRKDMPSKPGTYTLTGRRARWAEFPLWGGGKAQYWTRIDSSIAFHSVIYRSNNYNDPNMNSVRALGSRASAGCIRLTVADAKWIYDNIGKGVQVMIRDDLPADPELKAANKPGTFNNSTYLHNPTPAPTQAPAYNGAVPPSEIRNLKNGSQGEDVFWLQSKLSELGYYQGAITGTYLAGTANAVKAFQRANKLYASGNADRKTLEFLYSQVLLAHPPTPTPLPTDPPVPAGDFTPAPSTPSPDDYLVEPTEQTTNQP